MPGRNASLEEQRPSSARPAKVNHERVPIWPVELPDSGIRWRHPRDPDRVSLPEGGKAPAWPLASVEDIFAVEVDSYAKREVALQSVCRNLVEIDHLDRENRTRLINATAQFRKVMPGPGHMPGAAMPEKPAAKITDVPSPSSARQAPPAAGGVPGTAKVARTPRKAQPAAESVPLQSPKKPASPWTLDNSKRSGTQATSTKSPQQPHATQIIKPAESLPHDSVDSLASLERRTEHRRLSNAWIFETCPVYNTNPGTPKTADLTKCRDTGALRQQLHRETLRKLHALDEAHESVGCFEAWQDEVLKVRATLGRRKSRRLGRCSTKSVVDSNDSEDKEGPTEGNAWRSKKSLVAAMEGPHTDGRSLAIAAKKGSPVARLLTKSEVKAKK